MGTLSAHVWRIRMFFHNCVGWENLRRSPKTSFSSIQDFCGPSRESSVRALNLFYMYVGRVHGARHRAWRV